jgi:hypothetical protein
MIAEFDAMQLALEHVREGRERIARQEALILKLEAHGHFALVPEAEDILAWLEKTQLMFEEHLAEKKRTAAERLKQAQAFGSHINAHWP